MSNASFAASRCFAKWYEANECRLNVQSTCSQNIVAEIASQSDNPDRLIEAMRLCDGLRTRKRLSFAHPKECYLECRQDSALALEWLGKAEENGWSVSQMRREIRRSFAVSSPDPHGSGSITLTSDLSRLKCKIVLLTSERPI
jgi:hypothetical protein